MTISSMRGPRRCGLLTRHWPESATYRIGIGCQPLRAGDGHSYPSAGRLGHAEGMESVATTHLTRSRELHLASRWEEACVEYGAADAAEPLAVEDLASYAEAAQVSARGAVLHTRLLPARGQME